MHSFSDGGAIYLDGYFLNLLITETLFDYCKSDKYGGALYIEESIEDCMNKVCASNCESKYGNFYCIYEDFNKKLIINNTYVVKCAKEISIGVTPMISSCKCFFDNLNCTRNFLYTGCAAISGNSIVFRANYFIIAENHYYTNVIAFLIYASDVIINNTNIVSNIRYGDNDYKIFIFNEFTSISLSNVNIFYNINVKSIIDEGDIDVINCFTDIKGYSLFELSNSYNNTFRVEISCFNIHEPKEVNIVLILSLSLVSVSIIAIIIAIVAFIINRERNKIKQRVELSQNLVSEFG